MKKKFVLATLSVALVATAISGAALSQKEIAKAGSSRVFEMVDGASIRTVYPTGIRFKAKMDESYYEEITQNEDVKLYVAIVPYTYYEEYLAVDEQTRGNFYPWLDGAYDTYLNLEMDEAKIYAETDEYDQTYYYANAVMSNVNFNNHNVEFVGVAYIQRGAEGNYTYQDVNGLKEEDNVRSVFSVACKATADSVAYAQYTALLDDLVEKSMYNAYGLTYNKKENKYVYETTAYDDYAQAKTALGIDVVNSTVSIEDETDWILNTETRTLTPKLTYSDGTMYSKKMEYTWQSSNSDVATVDKTGKLTAVTAGETEIALSAVGGKFTTKKTFTVKDENVFNSGAFLDQGYTDSGSRPTSAWNATDNAWDVTMHNTLQGITYTTNGFSVPLDELKRMVELGENYAKFEVQVDEKFFGGAPVIGVYANRAGDSRCTCHPGVVPRTTIADGWLLYKGEIEKADVWTTIALDLTKIASIETLQNCTATRLTVAWGGADGSVIRFRNFTPITEEEYSQAVYSKLNLMDASHTFEPYQVTAVYDSTEKAVKTTQLDKANERAPYGRLRSTDALTTVRSGVQAGKAYLTFQYKADESFVASSNNTIKVYVNQGNNATTTATYLIATATATQANTWKTVGVDLTSDSVATLLNNSGNTYLQIIVDGNVGSVIYFKDMTLMTTEEYATTYYASVNLMESMTGYEQYQLTAAYDATVGGIKVTNTTAGFVVPNSRLRSSSVLTTIKSAVEAGMTHLTFQYKADSAFVNSKNTGNQLLTNYFNVYIGIGGKWTTPENYFVQTITATEADVWTTVEIDLQSEAVKALLNDSNNTHFAFIFGGDVGSVVCLKNMTFIKK